MQRVRISRWLASAAACSLLLAAGCAPEAAQMKDATATLALKFSPGDSATYKTIIERERNIKWEGSVPDDPVFAGGRNHHRIETIFTQEIQSVDDNGDATAKITFNQVKYSSTSKSGKSFNFDTANPKDPKHPLAMLIGQSYTIKIDPAGQVVKVIDTKDAETAARKGSVIPVEALRLLKPQAIKIRHGTLTLPDPNSNELHIGESWSNKMSVNFGMMGKESYEKIYTLNKIKGKKNRQIAVITMQAIPASGTEETADLIKNSDIRKTYTGELEVDLAAGNINNYLEKLQQEWTVVFPSTGEETGEDPALLTMTETRLYHIEKVD